MNPGRQSHEGEGLGPEATAAGQGGRTQAKGGDQGKVGEGQVRAEDQTLQQRQSSV